MAQKIPLTLIAVAVLGIIAAGIIVLALTNGQETAEPVMPGSGVHASPAATIPVRVVRTATPGPADILHGTAVPEPKVGSFSSNATSVTGSPTEQHPAASANGCIMVPVEDGFIYENITGFNAGSAQNYSVPVPMKNAGITAAQAEEYAKQAFPHYFPDRVETAYSDGSQNDRGWKFSLYKDNRQLVLGTLSADTGDLTGYSIPSGSIPDQGNSPPVTTLESARPIAENEIQERNGKIAVKPVDSLVNQDGNYVFSYRRIIRGVPCSKDGISLVVSKSGSVIRYYKQWSVPENAVAAQIVPAISRDAAIALVERVSRACYPDSSEGFRILSADPEWKDLYNPDEFTPLPGVIPLTWHVRFDDTTIQAQKFPVPGEGWVDAQNGTLMSLYYGHGH